MDSREIKQMEDMGFNVLDISRSGSINYQTKQDESWKYCNSCQFLKLVPDPDPCDSFGVCDKKALCGKWNDRLIARGLNVFQQARILVPAFCPTRD
ncbi:MAG: hypothetical protein E7311_00090 [Clostridiales bacterium]|nr:hypothetical protein [Clostridiales bacterium]